MIRFKKRKGQKTTQRHFNVSHLYERVSRGVETLVDGKGDLRSRLFGAWNSVAPLLNDKWPPDLDPVFRRIVDELVAEDRTEEQQAETARQLLRLYRHLTEFRSAGHPERRLKTEQILEQPGPAVLIVGPSGITTQSLRNFQ